MTSALQTDKPLFSNAQLRSLLVPLVIEQILVVAVGMAWLLGMKLGLGLAGIWMAFAMDECLRAIIFWARWKSGRWKDLQTV